MDNHISVSLPVQTSVIIPLSRGQRLPARASKEAVFKEEVRQLTAKKIKGEEKRV